MFYKVKKHWVFVSSKKKKCMRSYILTNELAHHKVTKYFNTAMFLKCIYQKS